MKTLRTLIFTLLLAFAAGGIAPTVARADDDSPSLDYFYDQLQPYGQWVQVDGYGYCWQPNAGQDPNWQPYTDGYWAYTDEGWTWASYEDFGWITYHYGRWTQVEDAGWVWVPGYDWAPAWVSWRQSRGESGGVDASYIGWAPLPPEAQFQSDIGFSVSVDTDYDIGPRFYSFCRMRDFGAPVLGGVIIDRSRNVTIINNTVNITNITTNNNVIFNGGPSYRGLSRRVDPAHPIQTLQLVRQTNAGDFRGGKGSMAHTQGNQLIVAAPLIARPKQPFTPPKVARVFDKPKIDRGWAGTNPQQKLQIQTVLKTQNKGIKPHQPARQVTAQQLSVIPNGNAPVPPQPPQGPKGLPPGKNPLPANVAAPTPPPNPAQPAKTPFNRRGRPPGPLATPGNPAAQQPANVSAQPTPPNPGQPPQTPPDKRTRPAKGPLTPFNQGASTTTPPASQGNPPPQKPPQPPNNGAANAEQQRLLQQQKAAQSAARQQQLEQQKDAAAHRSQEQVQTPKPPPPQPQQPKPPVPQPKPPGPVPPARGGRPTPTPTPH